MAGDDTPEQLFATLLADQPSRPFVTYYDEATGERAELSVRSLANWVAKTHFLLGDELGLGAGARALVLLPPHWISVPVLLGSLTAGLSFTATPSDADVAFVEPATAAEAAGVPDVYSIAPESAASGLGDGVPAGAVDYVAAVRPQADAWGGVRFGAGPDAAFFSTQSRRDAVRVARERAAALGLDSGARVLTTRDWRGVDDWVDAVLVPLVVGGSLVIVRHAPDEDVITRRMSQERATARL